jgi:hypothetical protein
MAFDISFPGPVAAQSRLEYMAGRGKFLQQQQARADKIRAQNKNLAAQRASRAQQARLASQQLAYRAYNDQANRQQRMMELANQNMRTERSYDVNRQMAEDANQRSLERLRETNRLNKEFQQWDLNEKQQRELAEVDRLEALYEKNKENMTAPEREAVEEANFERRWKVKAGAVDEQRKPTAADHWASVMYQGTNPDGSKKVYPDGSPMIYQQVTNRSGAIEWKILPDPGQDSQRKIKPTPPLVLKAGLRQKRGGTAFYDAPPDVFEAKQRLDLLEKGGPEYEGVEDDLATLQNWEDVGNREAHAADVRKWRGDSDDEIRSLQNQMAEKPREKVRLEYNEKITQLKAEGKDEEAADLEQKRDREIKSTTSKFDDPNMPLAEVLLEAQEHDDEAINSRAANLLLSRPKDPYAEDAPVPAEGEVPPGAEAPAEAAPGADAPVEGEEPTAAAPAAPAAPAATSQMAVEAPEEYNKSWFAYVGGQGNRPETPPPLYSIPPEERDHVEDQYMGTVGQLYNYFTDELGADKGLWPSKAHEMIKAYESSARAIDDPDEEQPKTWKQRSEERSQEIEKGERENKTFMTPDPNVKWETTGESGAIQPQGGWIKFATSGKKSKLRPSFLTQLDELPERAMRETIDRMSPNHRSILARFLRERGGGFRSVNLTMANSWVDLNVDDEEWRAAVGIDSLVKLNNKPWSRWPKKAKAEMESLVQSLKPESLGQFYHKPEVDKKTTQFIGTDLMPSELVKNIRAHNEVIKRWQKKYR